ncbi:MAG: HYExAFE family protein [Nitrososphaerales archaeon]
MTKRRGMHSEYEKVFEEIIRTCEIPYIAINEAKRAVVRGKKIKSLDFIVASKNGIYLLDIKGKTFPYGWPKRSIGPRDYWENWVHKDDLEGMELWSKLFESRKVQSLLVFVYKIVKKDELEKFVDYVKMQNTYYGFVAIPASVYKQHWKQRSKAPGFTAMYISRSEFPRFVKPFSNFLPKTKKILKINHKFG